MRACVRFASSSNYTKLQHHPCTEGGPSATPRTSRFSRRADRLRVMTSGAENHASMWFMFCVLSSDVTPDSRTRARRGNETRDASQTSICQSRPILPINRLHHRCQAGVPPCPKTIGCSEFRHDSDDVRIATMNCESHNAVVSYIVGRHGRSYTSAASKQYRMIAARVSGPSEHLCKIAGQMFFSKAVQE
jgi:hypothetical protein